MVGFTVHRKPNGITLWFSKNKSLRLDQDTCNKLAKTIWLAQRKYWKITHKEG